MKSLLLSNGQDSTELLQKVILERIEEGLGEAILELGHENNGDSMNLTLDLWNIAYAKLELAARNVDAVCQLLLTNNVGGEAEAVSTTATPSKDKSCTGKVLLRRAPKTIEEAIETRIAVVGNGEFIAADARRTNANAAAVDAGKSSLLGVLVKGDLDDGRGKARVNLFRHKHEIETGRTSSVGMEILGFDAAGKVVTSDTPGRMLL